MSDLALHKSRFSTATLGVLACSMTMMLVGTSVALAPLLSDYPVLAGQAWRYTLASATLLGALAVRGQRLPRLTPRQAGRLILLAATGLAGFNWFIIEGAKRADPAFLASVAGATPIVLAVMAPLLGGSRIRPQTLAGSVAVALGIVTVQGATMAPAGAIPYAVGVLLCEVAFTLLAVPLLRTMTALQLSTAVCSVAGPLLVAMAAVEPGTDLVWPNLSELGVLIYLAVLTTAVAFLLWYGGVMLLGADQAGLFAGLMPVAGLVAGVILGTAVWSYSALGGSLLCGLGIVIGLWRGSSTPSRRLVGRHHRGEEP